MHDISFVLTKSGNLIVQVDAVLVLFFFLNMIQLVIKWKNPVLVLVLHYFAV